MFTDVSSNANLLLINLKEVIDKLQSERNFFKTQTEKLQIEKQQLIILNKSLTNKVESLKGKLKTKYSW